MGRVDQITPEDFLEEGLQLVEYNCPSAAWHEYGIKEVTGGYCSCMQTQEKVLGLKIFLHKWDVEGLKKEAGHSSLVINGVC